MLFTMLETSRGCVLEVETTNGKVVLVPCLSPREAKELREDLQEEQFDAMSPDEKKASHRESARAKAKAAKAAGPPVGVTAPLSKPEVVDPLDDDQAKSKAEEGKS